MSNETLAWWVLHYCNVNIFQSFILFKFDGIDANLKNFSSFLAPEFMNNKIFYLFLVKGFCVEI